MNLFQKSILTFLAVPAFLAALYFSLACGLWGTPLFSIATHLLLLFLWVTFTWVSTRGFRFLLAKTGMAHPEKAAALFPAFSFYLLFLCYLSSSVGRACWGESPTRDILLRFLPEIPSLTRSFSINPWFLVFVLGSPLMFLVLLFQLKAGDFKKQEFPPNTSGHRSPLLRRFLWTFAWVLVLSLFLSHKGVVRDVLVLPEDPVACLLLSKHDAFPWTPRRMDWAQKDAVARKLTQPRIPKYRNIILFIVDALRADHLSIYGYNRPVDPFLSSLMASGRAERVQTAFSNGTESLGGILSTLTSKNVRDISPLNYTLPDLLFENGFRTTLFLSGGHDWYGLKKAEAHSPSLIRDGYDNPGPNGSADDKLLLENAESLPPDDGGRHFFYFHLMSVHQAGYFDEKYRKYAPSQNFIRFEFDPGYNHSPRDDGEFVNMYDDRILQADDIIRQVMECLKKKGYLNNSLGVVTADHGQLLGEHGKLGHGPNPYYGDLRIPMIFFSSAPLPALGGKDFGLQMDLSPTLVDLAGLEIPFSWQGHSLLTQRPPGWSVHRAGVIRPRCEGAVVYHSAHSLLKYSRSLTPGEDPDEMFFDLKKDPQEKSNLIYSLSAPRLQEIRRIADKLLQP